MPPLLSDELPLVFSHGQAGAREFIYAEAPVGGCTPYVIDFHFKELFCVARPTVEHECFMNGLRRTFFLVGVIDCGPLTKCPPLLNSPTLAFGLLKGCNLCGGCLNSFFLIIQWGHGLFVHFKFVDGALTPTPKPVPAHGIG